MSLSQEIVDIRQVNVAPDVFSAVLDEDDVRDAEWLDMMEVSRLIPTVLLFVIAIMKRERLYQRSGGSQSFAIPNCHGFKIATLITLISDQTATILRNIKQPHTLLIASRS